MTAAQSEVTRLKNGLDSISSHTVKRVELQADVEQARTRLTEIERLLGNVKDKTITVQVRHVESRAGGGMVGFARGGRLSGYGGGDIVPAMLEPGEIVINKRRSSLFQDLLLAINFAPLSAVEQYLPRFATGGLVGTLPIPTLPSLSFATGGQVPEPSTPNGIRPSEIVQINFSMPNGQTYELFGARDRARQLRDDLKALQLGR